MSPTPINAGLLAGGLPPINPASIPANIRNGSQAAKNAYQEALGFESVLVNQLTQQMVSSLTGSPDGSSDGSSSADGSAAPGGMLGSDPASSEYASLLPSALTGSIMSNGGIGMAQQLVTALDPAINEKS